MFLSEANLNEHLYLPFLCDNLISSLSLSNKLTTALILAVITREDNCERLTRLILKLADTSGVYRILLL